MNKKLIGKRIESIKKGADSLTIELEGGLVIEASIRYYDLDDEHVLNADVYEKKLVSLGKL